jgi:hypothetical protein
MAKKARKARPIAPKRRQESKGKDQEVRWISAAEAHRAGIDAGSKIVKRHAAKQKFKVKLTASQMETIRSQLKRWNNTKPAEITFLVKGQTAAKFRVAAYAYRGDTCCA